jgi:long-chain fatty acid transport protein
MRRDRVGISGLLLAVALAANTPPAAEASGFQLVEQNGSGLGNAYAGQAAGVRDASAIFFNPAALTRINGRQFVVSVDPIGVGTDFTDASSGQPYLPVGAGLVLPVSAGGSGGDAGGWVPVPNGYLSWRVATPLWLGLGVNAPFGLKTEWDPDWIGRFHAVKSEVRTLNLNPTVAFRVSDALSLGVGASYQRLQAELTQNVAYGGVAFGAAGAAGGPAAAGAILAQLQPTGLSYEGLGRMEGDGWSWGWNAGLFLRLGDAAHVGVSYRSAVAHDLEGEVTFENAPTFRTTGPTGALGAGLNARFASGAVLTEVELPETFSVAASYERGRYEILADWTYTGWSSIQRFEVVRPDGSPVSTVPLNFDDTWRVGLGLNYRLDDRRRLRLGTAYDVTPVQDEHRTPRLPDEDRVWAAAGLEWKIGAKAALDVGYAHLFVGEATSELPNQETSTSAPSGPLVGAYSANVNVLSVQFRVGF